MPAPIVLANLDPKTKMGYESPKVATRADLRDGSGGGGNGGDVGGGATELATGQTIMKCITPYSGSFRGLAYCVVFISHGREPEKPALG